MSKRILVVEDPPDNRQIIRDMLAPTDYEITEAENGEEALAAHLHSYATPFIRYNIGDLASLASECACGHFHNAARSTAFPQPAPGTAPSPGPMKVPDDQLRKMLGIANVTFKQNEQRLAIIDSPLQG